MFHALAQPIRNSDTRGFGGAGVPSQNHRFGLNPAIPANATAIALNVAGIAQAPGFITVWPGGPRPDTSVVNMQGGGAATNGAVVTGVSGGAFMIFNSVPAHLICDITGFWTP